MIDRIIQGDKKAFEAFYDKWDQRVFYFFLKNTGDRLIAEDLTQQTFIKCWEYRSSMTLDYSEEVQLFQKAKLIFIDWLRKEGCAHKIRSAEQAYTALQTSNDTAAYLDRSERLHQAIERLPAMRKKVIVLSHLEGQSYKEIASKLKISPKTVDNHIYQALKQLRKLLGLF